MTTATILPLPRACFFDANGNPLASGLVYTYVAGTTTPKTTWQDAGETTLNTNPIVLDANGSCLLYGSGSYTLTVTDALGNNIPAYSGLTVDTLSQAVALINAITLLVSPAVASIAALRTSTTTTLSQSQCYVVGYNTPADGGEGEFLYVSTDTTSADNGGTIIVDASNRRWYRDTQGQPFNVKWFGAKGDGTTDDTATIQSAFNGAVAAASGVYFPAGTFIVSGEIAVTPTSGMDISGAGRTVTYIKQSSSTANTFNINAPAQDVRIANFMLWCTAATPTAGDMIHFGNGGQRVIVEDLHTLGGYNICHFEGTSSFQEVVVSDCNFILFINDGIVVTGSFGGLGNFSNIAMDCNNTNGGHGYLITCGDTYQFANCNTQGLFSPWMFSPNTGVSLTDIYMVNCLADGAARGGPGGTSNAGYTFTTSGGSIARVTMANCWAGTMHNDGYLFVSAWEILLTNCIALSNGANGFEFQTGCQGFSMNGCMASGNSQQGSGTFDGIVVQPAVNHFVISGCISGVSPEFPSNIQRYNINVATGASDYYIITNNLLPGAITAGLNDGGTGVHKTVSGNVV